MKRKDRKIGALIVMVVLLLALASFFYVRDYYHSDETVRTYLSGSDQVTVTEIAEGLYVDGPGDENAVIFYPGAKVEYTAYLPLFYGVAEQGMDCFLVKMPCNLAILGQNKAEGILSDYHYEHWYLAGHSLGGAMASSWASSHPEELAGLILLAAYPTKDLKEAGFPVLLLYGSEDGVLNLEKVESGRKLMPADYTELCIEGGNHAGFGNYGEQKGDGAARISAKEQQDQTIAAIQQIMNKNNKESQERTVMG